MDEGDNGGKETGNNSCGRYQRDFIKTILDYSGNCNDTKWIPISLCLFVNKDFYELTVRLIQPCDCCTITGVTSSLVQIQQFHTYYNIGSFIFHIDWTCITSWVSVSDQ